MDKEILDMLKEFKQDFKIINVKLDGLENKFSGLESRQDKMFQVVKGLEHSAEVNKAEQDKISNDIVHIKGDVEGLRKDLANVEIITSSNWNDIAKLKLAK